VPASAAEDASALKERVARLERRLADVDAKLGLLLAQRAARHRPTSITQGSVDQLGPRELIVDTPREEASLGARAIDLPRRQPASEEPEPDVDSTAPAGAPSGASVEDTYQWAQGRLREGRYLEAIAVLEDIVERSPSHELADNAVYWIGWAHARRDDHQLAVDVWQRLPLRFPHSDKVPDALFGMAESHESLGEPAVAETLYEQLVAQHPKAEKVRDARKALARLRPR
jgi:TolA-binding protein